MTSDSDPSHAALLDRADRAIADAVVIRTKVRASLKAAKQRRENRAWSGDPPVPELKWPDPLPSLDALNLWCAVARALADAGPIVWKPDVELERAWQRMMPTIGTSLTPSQG